MGAIAKWRGLALLAAAKAALGCFFCNEAHGLDARALVRPVAERLVI